MDDNQMKGKIYVLAIGIEKYDVSVKKNPLPGCKKDVTDFCDYLKERFGEASLKITQLLDEQATRAHIIAAFLEKKKDEAGKDIDCIANAGEDDAFIFYYSGHGSEEKAPPEFRMANGKNETLLCYDSRMKGQYDLADKELNYLLSTVTQKVKYSVAVVDSCHSDSVMRNEGDMHKKHNPSEGNAIRPFSTYLPEVIAHYQNSDDLPGTHFITLSACSNAESAYCTSNGGHFTQNLLKVLKENPAKVPSYDELIYQIKARIGNARIPQHPQLGCWGEVNPHWEFLTRKIAQQQRMPVIFWEKDQAAWFVQAGAFHGYRLENLNAQKIPIYPKGKEDGEAAFYATIKELGVDKSKLEFEGRPPHMHEDVLLAGISRPAFRVKFVDPDDFIQKQLSSSAYNFINDPYAPISLQLVDGSYRIYRKGKKWQLVHGIPATDEEAAIYILNHIQDMADWHFAMELGSPLNSNIEEEKICFQLVCKAARRLYATGDTQHYELDFHGSEVPFELEFENKNPELHLHYALLHLDNKYNIDVWNEGGQTSFQGGSTISEEGEFFISEIDEMEVQDDFLLIVSRQALQAGSFKRLPFPDGKWGRIFDPSQVDRGARKGNEMRTRNLEQNWLVKRIRVTSLRKFR